MCFFPVSSPHTAAALYGGRIRKGTCREPEPGWLLNLPSYIELTYPINALAPYIFVGINSVKTYAKSIR